MTNDIATDLRAFARDRDAESASADFLNSVTTKFAEVDEDLLVLVQSSIEFAQECEESYYDGHAEDVLDPLHGTDHDPCAICQPTTDFDMAVANLHDRVRHGRDQAVAHAA